MIITLLIAIILLQLISLYNPPKRHGKTDYECGREWACEQYYKQGRCTEWIREQVEKNTWEHGSAYDKGIFHAVHDLVCRESL